MKSERLVNLICFCLHFVFYWLSQLRFQSCCQKAFHSAVALVSWAGGFEADSLKKYYTECCSVNWFQTMQQAAPEFCEDDQESDNEDDALRSARTPHPDLFYFLFF